MYPDQPLVTLHWRRGDTVRLSWDLNSLAVVAVDRAAEVAGEELGMGVGLAAAAL
jgi:hypothetical protein